MSHESTPNLNLYLPDDGEQEWGEEARENFRALDRAVTDVTTRLVLGGISGGSDGRAVYPDPANPNAMLNFVPSTSPYPIPAYFKIGGKYYGPGQHAPGLSGLQRGRTYYVTDTGIGPVMPFNGWPVIAGVAVTPNILQVRLTPVAGAGGSSVTFAFTRVTPAANALYRVVFTPSVTGVYGTIAEYAWDFGDGTQSADIQPTHDFPDAGAYNVTLVVTNSAGQAFRSAQVVTVTPVLPSVSFTATRDPNDGLKFNFAATASSLSGSIIRYDWEFGDDVGWYNGFSESAHWYLEKGSYVVTLTVTDSSGKKNTASQTVVAADNYTVDFTYTAQNRSGAEPYTRQFNATGLVSPNGAITGIHWNFGDGTTASGVSTVTHTFPGPGSYAVTLTATDAQGVTSATTKTVVNEQRVVTVTLPVADGADGQYNYEANPNTDPEGTADASGGWTRYVQPVNPSAVYPLTNNADSWDAFLQNGSGNHDQRVQIVEFTLPAGATVQTMGLRLSWSSKFASQDQGGSGYDTSGLYVSFAARRWPHAIPATSGDATQLNGISGSITYGNTYPLAGSWSTQYSTNPADEHVISVPLSFVDNGKVRLILAVYSNRTYRGFTNGTLDKVLLDVTYTTN